MELCDVECIMREQWDFQYIFCYFCDLKEKYSKVLRNNGSEYHSAACAGVRSLTISVGGGKT